MIEQATIDRLKNLLVEADDFGGYVDILMETFDGGRALKGQGKPVQNRILHETMNHLIADLYKKRMKLEIQMTRLPDLKFTHGVFRGSGTMGSFWYFEDIQLGMVYAYPDPDGGSAYLRFTAVVMVGNPRKN